jgi:glycosyltransferase involved in cell wall biosynthesis
VAPRWHILTGEYPPQPGGVSDYTRSVARGLAAAGDEVCVWSPRTAGAVPADTGVVLHRLPGRFGPLALAELEGALRRAPGRVLLQYTPHAFGYKAMNVPLCAWLWARRRHLDVMFHEVAYPFRAGQPWRHQLLAAVHRGMAALLLRAAERIFVSIPGWTLLLQRLASVFPAPAWTPVPTNLPTDYPPEEVAALRARLLRDSEQTLVGHFGTYGPTVTRLLAPALVEVLQASQATRVLLLGRGAAAFATELLRQRPDLTARLTTIGELDARAAGRHIAGCDVMLQPYPDGISSRRGSAMAALALGCPVVSTEGEWSESIWRASAAVALAAPDDLASAVLQLLRDTPQRTQLGRRAAALYQERFSVEHTIAALRS